MFYKRKKTINSVYIVHNKSIIRGIKISIRYTVFAIYFKFAENKLSYQEIPIYLNFWMAIEFKIRPNRVFLILILFLLFLWKITKFSALRYYILCFTSDHLPRRLVLLIIMFICFYILLGKSSGSHFLANIKCRVEMINQITRTSYSYKRNIISLKTVQFIRLPKSH